MQIRLKRERSVIVIFLAGALLPLQTAAAGAGIVAADLDRFDGLLLGCGAVTAHIFHHALGHAFPLDLLVLLETDGIEPADRLVLNGGDHFLEHGEGFTLVAVSYTHLGG